MNCSFSSNDNSNALLFLNNAHNLVLLDPVLFDYTSMYIIFLIYILFIFCLVGGTGFLGKMLIESCYEAALIFP